MKHLKRFNESFQKPGPDVDGSKKVSIDKDDINLFKDEPVLLKLLADDKISLLGNDVYYKDDETLDIIKQYVSKD